MINAMPPRPAMKPTPIVMSDRYQMPFMYSGMPISAPSSSWNTGFDRREMHACADQRGDQENDRFANARTR